MLAFHSKHLIFTLNLVIVVCLTSLTQLHVKAQDTLKFVSSTSNAPVPYVMVKPSNSEDWFTSNENGFAIIESKALTSSKSMVISTFGFETKTLETKLIPENKTISLNEKFIELDAIVVEEKALTFKTIGNTEYSAKSIESANRRTGKKQDPSYATYVDFPNNKEKLVTKLNVFLSEDGDKNVSFILRVMVTDELKKIQEDRLYSINKLIDLKYDNIHPFKLTHYGWNEIDLIDYNISIPAKYDHVLIVLETVRYNNEQQKNLVVPFQNNSKEKNLNAALNFGSQFVVFDKREGHFAIAVEYAY